MPVPLANSDLSERKGIILLPQFPNPMLTCLVVLLTSLFSVFRSRASLELENLALRHQIGVLQRTARKRLKITSIVRLLWVWLVAYGRTGARL